MRFTRLFGCVSPALLALCFGVEAQAVIVVLNETFANDSGFTKDDSDTVGDTKFFVSSSKVDYWGINAGTGGVADYDADADAPPTGVPAYTGFTTSFFNGDDINSPGTEPYEIPLSLTWSGLPIAGLTGLSFSGLFAAEAVLSDGSGGDFEHEGSSSSMPFLGDYIRVQYRLNGAGSFIDLLAFSGQNVAGDDALALDTNFDGLGDSTALNETAASFSAAISGTGTTLDLRVLMSVDQNSEAFAFDSFSITGIPEPSAFLFGGLACGIVGLISVGRRYVRTLFVKDHGEGKLSRAVVSVSK